MLLTIRMVYRADKISALCFSGSVSEALQTLPRALQVSSTSHITEVKNTLLGQFLPVFSFLHCLLITYLLNFVFTGSSCLYTKYLFGICSYEAVLSFHVKTLLLYFQGIKCNVLPWNIDSVDQYDVQLFQTLPRSVHPLHQMVCGDILFPAQYIDCCFTCAVLNKKYIWVSGPDKNDIT